MALDFAPRRDFGKTGKPLNKPSLAFFKGGNPKGSIFLFNRSKPMENGDAFRTAKEAPFSGLP